jgi:2,3,4,5-tetrahydropyridine-2-carboxylate N-succinyltransferase
MKHDHILDDIDKAFLTDNIDEQKLLINQLLDALENGSIRAAEKHSSGWVVNSKVKQGILRAFKIGIPKALFAGDFTFIDKDTVLPRKFSVDNGARLVGNATCVRRGAYIGKQVILMSPSFVNIGAFIDDGCLIDSNALVGSCAQVGKRVHISAGAQIGGVLEPIGSLPVIIEDDVLIGGNCGIYEGIQIGEKAVLGAGVILTQSTPIFDLVNECVITHKPGIGLKVPNNAVVVPGARAINSNFAKTNGLSISCPIIIKYRDDKTNTKIMLEDLLR